MAASYWRQRWLLFVRQPVARWSLWLLCLVFALSLCAELIANDRPLLVRYADKWFFPVLVDYPETAFDGIFDTSTQYTDPYVAELIQAQGWMLWPPIRFGGQTIDVHLNQNHPAPPDLRHLLGTDDQGRDVLARIIYGTRISLLFSLILTLGSTIIGVAFGAIQGYYGGLIDLIAQRFMEIWGGLPVLFLLILLASLLQPNFWLLLGLLLLFNWMALVDLVRAEFLRGRNFVYVKSAQALGQRDRVIIFQHLLPNAMVATFTFLPFIFAIGINTLTSLDFLGYGLPPGTPSLGELVAQAKANLHAPWLAACAFGSLTLILTLTVLVGEGLRNAFDPRKVASLSRP